LIEKIVSLRGNCNPALSDGGRIALPAITGD
jgi:hypothetical protein